MIVKNFNPGIAKLWISSFEEIEVGSQEQIHNLTKLPIIFRHVAIMPDVHLGIGATIGSVIPTIDAVIPSAVGVDIACGMVALNLNMTIEDLFKKSGFKDLETIYHQITRCVPMGEGRGHNKIPNNIHNTMKSMYEKASDKIMSVSKRGTEQLGTLGGGNHFIEIQEDTNKNIWIMIHSGSRNIGNRVANMHIKKAKEMCNKYKVQLPDKALAFLPEGTKEFDEYWEDVQWCQEYAYKNRKTMLEAILKELSLDYMNYQSGFKPINCHHNFVEKEHHYGHNIYVTRKGATRVRNNNLAIIPGAMGRKSYIVRPANGEGNPESFYSCSHGAGRKMSRSKARDKFSATSEIERQTKGLVCKKDKRISDELPEAYKDIDEVMKNQEDLVEIVYELKALICLKG